MSWQDIEDIFWYWLNEADDIAWADLDSVEDELSYVRDVVRPRRLRSRERYAVSCLELDLQVRLCIIADEVKPELRLSAASRSNQESRGW